MRSMRFLAAMAATGLMAATVGQADATSPPPTASGTVATTATGALNTYAFTLDDALGSPSPIGSVWEAWVPGQFYMTSDPSSVTAPMGWTSNVTPGGGGYAIQWVASSSAFDVLAGQSLSGFGFQSPDLPANIDGNSTVFPGVPTLTSVAYDGALFSDSGTTFAFTPTPIPEPTTIALLAPGALMLFMCRRPRRSA